MLIHVNPSRNPCRNPDLTQQNLNFQPHPLEVGCTCRNWHKKRQILKFQFGHVWSVVCSRTSSCGLTISFSSLTQYQPQNWLYSPKITMTIKLAIFGRYMSSISYVVPRYDLPAPWLRPKLCKTKGFGRRFARVKSRANWRMVIKPQGFLIDFYLFFYRFIMINDDVLWWCLWWCFYPTLNILKVTNRSTSR